MVGNRADMLARIKAVLPSRWFGDSTPVLDGALSGAASAWSMIYGQLSYASNDFFGGDFPRRLSESDANYRSRILLELVRERGTRRAVVAALTDLTGRRPAVIEPWRPADTGAWAEVGGASCGLGYGVAGAWGSREAPYQFFVRALRPIEMGVPYLAGYGDACGGYGRGAVAWMSGSAMGTQATDQEIYLRVAEVLPVCATAWVSISP
jgi:hypothetical protein